MTTKYDIDEQVLCLHGSVIKNGTIESISINRNRDAMYTIVAKDGMYLVMEQSVAKDVDTLLENLKNTYAATIDISSDDEYNTNDNPF